MPRQSCPHARGPLPSVPGPLPGRVEHPGAGAVPPAPPAPVRRMAEVEMRVRRHPHPIPAAVSPSLEEVQGLLRQQNQLLAELLASLNGLTVAVLARER